MSKKLTTTPKNQNTKNNQKSKTTLGAPDKDHAFPSLRVSQFRKLKIALAEREKQNHDRIILLPCSGGRGWYEIADHSALFYYYLACLPLNRKTQFNEDDDFFCQAYRFGRIRTKDVNSVRKRLKAVNIYKQEIWHNGCVSFILERTIPKTEVDELWKKEQSRRDRLQNIANIDNLAPNFYKHYTAIAKRLYQKIQSDMSETNRAAIGQSLISDSIKIFLTYCELTNLPPTKAPEKWDEIIKNIREIIYKLQAVADFGIWSLELSGSIGREFVSLLEIAEEEKAKAIRNLKTAKENKNDKNQ